MPEFHFLRPWWLAALPVGLWLIWRLLGSGSARGSWLAVVDARLQPHVLARPDALGRARWPLVTAGVGWLLACIALSGPTWERLPVPAFRSDEALVVVLDLSRSMDAGDLQPSRLAQAKIKLLSLLERRTSGQTGLVVFSAHAFTVTPLTTDTATIASLVTALSSDIMPSRGSYLEAGLARARTLLEQTGMTRGEILVLTDAQPSERSFDVARDLRRAGFTASVLAVGTAEGAPIPEIGGGFVTDRAGQVVVPQLDAAALRRFADAGGGRFAQLTADDRDLDILLPEGGTGFDAALETEEDPYEADVWRDEGIWLAVALLPLLALGFRRGWVAAWLVVFLLPAPRVDAFEWQDLWKRPDQRGFEAMQAEEPQEAAALFDDPAWRAAAEYRTGEYAQSAATLAPLDSTESHYNRGNAFARAGELEQAIAEYDETLRLDPQHEDAIYNRDLVRQLLEQQQQDQQSQQDGSDQQQSAQSSPENGQDENGESEGERSDGQDGDQSQQSASADGEQGSGDQPKDGETGDDQAEQQADAGDESEGAPGDEGDPQQQTAATGPEDVEQWASDQAAEQWLRRIPQDPGGLLRRKFLYQYQRLGVDQDGNYVWPGDESKPW
jgi:Ca-activated chloride channel homolog